MFFKEAVRSFFHFGEDSPVAHNRDFRASRGPDPCGWKWSGRVLAPVSGNGFWGNALAVKSFVLDNQGRPVNGCEQICVQDARIVMMVNRQDARAGDSQEVLLQSLAVGWSISSPSTHWCADNHGYGYLPVVNPVEYGCVVDELVGRQSQKIPKHDFTDRAHAGHSETGAQSHQCRLAD